MIALHPYVFLFNDTATTEIYTLSLHDALPILLRRNCGVNLLDCTTTRFVLWIDAPLDVAPQRLANSRFPDEGALTNSRKREILEHRSLSRAKSRGCLGMTSCLVFQRPCVNRSWSVVRVAAALSKNRVRARSCRNDAS